MKNQYKLIYFAIFFSTIAIGMENASNEIDCTVTSKILVTPSYKLKDKSNPNNIKRSKDFDDAIKNVMAKLKLEGFLGKLICEYADIIYAFPEEGPALLINAKFFLEKIVMIDNPLCIAKSVLEPHLNYKLIKSIESPEEKDRYSKFLKQINEISEKLRPELLVLCNEFIDFIDTNRYPNSILNLKIELSLRLHC